MAGVCGCFKHTDKFKCSRYYPARSNDHDNVVVQSLCCVLDCRVKYDSSIVCNPRLPSCYQAELVSPVLRGRAGLYNTFDVMRAIKTHHPFVNKSTGMHVHVSAFMPSAALHCMSHQWVVTSIPLDHVHGRSCGLVDTCHAWKQGNDATQCIITV